MPTSGRKINVYRGWLSQMQKKRNIPIQLIFINRIYPFSSLFPARRRNDMTRIRPSRITFYSSAVSKKSLFPPKNRTMAFSCSGFLTI